jgi:hypothetical protein
VFPLGHLAVGYLTFVVYRHYRSGDPTVPMAGVLLALAVGTQFPDLVDKPLSHWGVLVSGRSLGHSVLLFLPLSGVVWWVAKRTRRREQGVAFLVGVVSHLVADSYRVALRGEWAKLTHLLYPVTTPIDYPSDQVSPLLRVLRYYATPEVTVEIAVIVLVLVLLTWQLWRVSPPKLLPHDR